MEIYLIDNKSIGAPNLADAMRKKGWKVKTKQTDIDGQRRIASLEEELESEIRQTGYDYLVSFNYYPVLAEVCHRCGLKYISWVYDSPLVALYSYTMVYDTNYVFLVDYTTYKELKEIGLQRVFYLPLASNTWNSPFFQESYGKYPHMQVSFIGSMYDEKRNDLYSKLSNVSDFSKGYLDALIQVQKNLYGVDIIKNAIPEKILEELREIVPYHTGINKDGVEKDTYIYEEYFLKRKVTALERKEVLQRLSRKWDIYLFSGRKPEYLPEIHYMGMVDYYTEMPQVFCNSDINLNITLKSIGTGIPERILDIMGVGGFLLTNYQAEMEEYFQAGVDYDYYGDMEDMEEKVGFYLKNPQIRERIAASGYEKIGKFFNYNERLEEMIRLVEEN